MCVQCHWRISNFLLSTQLYHRMHITCQLATLHFQNDDVMSDDTSLSILKLTFIHLVGALLLFKQQCILRITSLSVLLKL